MPELYLEEHQKYSNMGPLPAASLETVSPGGNFKLDAAQHSPVLQIGMSQGTNLLVEGDLGSNFVPLLLDAWIRRAELTQSAESLQCFGITAFRYEPSRRKWKEEYA